MQAQDSDGPSIAQEPFPILRRSDSMTNVHYCHPIACAARLRIKFLSEDESNLLSPTWHSKTYYPHSKSKGTFHIDESNKFDYSEASTSRELSMSVLALPHQPEDGLFRDRAATQGIIRHSDTVIKPGGGQTRMGSIEDMKIAAQKMTAAEAKRLLKQLKKPHYHSTEELKSASRQCLSPRSNENERTDDTHYSRHDAETYVLKFFWPNIQSDLNKLPSNRPVSVEVEFHGSAGPCGITSEEGCKGRFLKASQTIHDLFMKKAAPGSTLKTMSVYLWDDMAVDRSRKDVEPKREWPTTYGYRNPERRIYGRMADEKFRNQRYSYMVKTHTILEATKPE